MSGPGPSLLLLDPYGPRCGGLAMLTKLAQNPKRVPVVVLSGASEASRVVETMRSGAVDYLVKPFEDRDLDAAVERAVTQPGEAVAIPAAEAPGTPFASTNPRLMQIQAISDQVARTDVPVLILGESGVGKEVLARYIHERSGRRDPFVKVNCAALPTDLLESELFGHERGAFTGAQREKPGKFEQAGQGTIMLDEVGEMSAPLQAKLLHVLQDGGEYNRLGATRTLKSEARIIAATNKPLHTLVGSGEFREDLYFRLNVITIEVPPLRERPEDIRVLCARFVEQYRVKYNSPLLALPEDLLEAFSRYHWPGNVRQLENSVRRFLIIPDIEQAVAILHRSTAAAEEIQVSMSQKAAPAATTPVQISLKDLSANAAEKAEKELILQTLNEMNWNRKQAAKRLDICYKSLLNKLHRWQLGSQADISPAGVSSALWSKRRPVQTR